LNDPKVQNLPDSLFRGYINLLCVAKEYGSGGDLPLQKDMAFFLRSPQSRVKKLCESLQKFGLLEQKNDTYSIHNWDKRQYESDNDLTATLRKRKQRERDKTENVTRDVTDMSRVTSRSKNGNVTRTETETETETETDIERNINTRESRAQKNDDQPSPPETDGRVAVPEQVSPPSPAPPPIFYRGKQYRTSMIDAIRKLFTKLNPQGFTDPRREFSASVELADKFLRMGRDDPVHFGSAVIETYRGMIADGRDKFWRHQPLTALNLNKSGIFDQVIAEIRAQEGAAGSGFDEFAAAEAHG